MFKNLNTKRFWLICLAVAVLLFVYIVLRAKSLSFTHDEAMSYNVVKVKDYFEYTANNHLLNTWLMSASSAVFGESELALRLPNVLAFALYLFFCSKIILRFKNTAYLLFAIPLLFLNPFVLDFFSMARGYGLEMGFMSAALYFYLRRDFTEFILRDFLKDFGLGMFFAMLALLAGLSMINFYIALLFIFVAEYVLSVKKDPSRSGKKHLSFFLIFLLACIPLLLSVKRLLIISKAGDLYVGADSFDQSISSFIERSAYFQPYPVWFSEVLQSFIEYIFPIGLIIALLRKNTTGPLMKLGVLMTIILTGIYLEHYIFGTLFPLSRTGIYFIPMFGLFIFYLFMQFTGSLKPLLHKVFVAAGLILVSLPLSFHFFKTLNLSYAFEWKYETHTRQAVEEVAKAGMPVTLGHNWIYGPAINYYVRSRNLSITPVKLEEGKSYKEDYIYEFTDQLKDSSWTQVSGFPDIGSAVYKKPD